MNQWDAQKVRRFRHVFLDAEGTLYVPKNGKSRWEFWADPSPDAAVEFFELDKNVKESLEALRGQVETLCIVSKNPKEILTALLDKFGIRHLFDEIMLNDNKGKLIAKYLYRKGLKREEAVMVGDMPVLDLYPVRRIGVEAILVDRPYNSWAKAERIKGISELPSWLKIADLAEEMGQRKSHIASLDDFHTADVVRDMLPRLRSAQTKSLMAIPNS
jgi:phosphoglycolate phosphatase-like HAD superfamily hydrolase